MSVCRAIRFCLLACLAALVVVPVASAAPLDVIGDYWSDGQIDPGKYTTADLKGALRIVGDQGGQYDAFKDLVNAEITARLVGGHDDARPASAPVGKGGTPTTDGTTTSGENQVPPGSVPTPPASVADGDVPVGFILLSAAAGVLVLVGGGMALTRRFRR